MKGTPAQNMIVTFKYSQCEYLAKTLIKQSKSSKTRDTCTRVRDALLQVTSAPMVRQRCQWRERRRTMSQKRSPREKDSSSVQPHN